MHDPVTCRRSSTLGSSAAEFDFLQLLSSDAPGSTSTEELQQGGAPDYGDDDDDDEDTGESGDEDEEQINIFDELLDFCDPLFQSPSSSIETGAGTECPPLVGFDDQDVQPLSVFEESTPTVLRTASAADSAEETARAREMESERLALLPDPHGQKPESWRTAARSRSLPSAYSEPAQCSSRTEARTRSDAIDTDTQVAQIPLVVRTEPYDSDYEDD